MYDIKQFRPALYVLLIMGVTGFALAAQSPMLWVLATGGIMLNAWLIKTDRFRPMPRIIANGVTLLALLYVLMQVIQNRQAMILVIGQFLVLLQIVKLFEQRANRDFAQLLVLSLLLMVAAAINTASLIFAMLFISYLFLSLYCCLLFHLKVETDDARKAIALREELIHPATLRQNQRYLSSSMLRLTGLVATFALALAVIVFLFFPRGAGAGLFGQFQFQPSQTLTGFDDQMGFQQVARITQNEEIVAYVKIFKNDQPLPPTGTLLLRGVALEIYTGNDNTAGGRWRWLRARREEQGATLTEHSPTSLPPSGPGPNRDGVDIYRQEFMLRPTGTSVLFALPGALEITTDRRLDLRYAPYDGVMESTEPLVHPLNYTVLSTDQIPLGEGPAATPVVPNLPRPMRRLRGSGYTDARPTQSQIDPKIRDFALRKEVTDPHGDGTLAQRRLNLGARPGAPGPMDEQIALNIEKYLQSNFTYTLDLTDAARINDQDPMVAFLYDLKRGHCEYFAGAMTLLCQSLGMEARVVLGFKCDGGAYNDFHNSYVVRQSHAHAWVEVRTANGWKTFDPTSGRESDKKAQQQAGAWQKIQHFFDFLEYTWANNVVAYDHDSRNNLVQAVESRMSKTVVDNSQRLGNISSLMDLLPSWLVSSVLGILMGLMILILVGAIVWFLYERWKLRRRAARIGLDNLSTSDQVRLVKQLGFYDDLVRLLARHQITRPRHQTPQEFSESLTYLPNEVFEGIRRLTGIFYRIRYGDAALNSAQQRRLGRVIDRMDSSLSNGNGR